MTLMGVARVAGRAAVAVLAVAAVALVALLVVTPRAVGGGALTVRSGSMTPTYPVGSVVVVRPVDPMTIEVGDAITFSAPDSGSLTTHRVVDIGQDEGGRQFTTQGDANPTPDREPVVGDAVRGVVWFHVPYIGSVRDLIASPVGMVIIGVGLAGLVLLEWRRDRSATASSTTIGTAPAPAPAPVSDGSGADESPDVSRSESGQREPVEAGVPAGLATPRVGAGARGDVLAVRRQLLVARLACGAFGRSRPLELVELLGGRVEAVSTIELAVTVVVTPDEVAAVLQLLETVGLYEYCVSDVVSVGQVSSEESEELPGPPVVDRADADARPDSPMETGTPDGPTEFDPTPRANGWALELAPYGPVMIDRTLQSASSS